MEGSTQGSSKHHTWIQVNMSSANTGVYGPYGAFRIQTFSPIYCHIYPRFVSPYLPCCNGQWGFDHLYFEIAVAKNIDIVEAETPLWSSPLSRLCVGTDGAPVLGWGDTYGN